MEKISFGSLIPTYNITRPCQNLRKENTIIISQIIITVNFKIAYYCTNILLLLVMHIWGSLKHWLGSIFSLIPFIMQQKKQREITAATRILSFMLVFHYLSWRFPHKISCFKSLKYYIFITSNAINHSDTSNGEWHYDGKQFCLAYINP